MRNRSKELVELLGDVEKIRTERRKAKANKHKYTGTGNDAMSFTSGGSRYGGFGSDSFSSYSGGGYGGGGSSSSYNGGGGGSGSYSGRGGESVVVALSRTIGPNVLQIMIATTTGVMGDTEARARPPVKVSKNTMLATTISSPVGRTLSQARLRQLTQLLLSVPRRFLLHPSLHLQSLSL